MTAANVSGVMSGQEGSATSCSGGIATYGVIKLLALRALSEGRSGEPPTDNESGRLNADHSPDHSDIRLLPLLPILQSEQCQVSHGMPQPARSLQASDQLTVDHA